MKRWTMGLALASLAVAATADEKPRQAFAVVDQEAGVPVFAGDLPYHPYDVIGPVKAHVRKATIFSAASSRAKIYRELWERAKKMGADAVINASYGRSHVNAISWGSTTAEGTAIRFRKAAG